MRLEVGQPTLLWPRPSYAVASSRWTNVATSARAPLAYANIRQHTPSPAIRRLREMQVADGNVLLENVYFADNVLRRPVNNWQQWPGIAQMSELNNEYGRYLFSLSSPLPEAYRHNINNYGYHLRPGAALFFPGVTGDLIRLAFAISAATQLK
ncbi:MAG TPA: hypothetical protein VGR57_04860 [Ktedonobacterales bacterium]|nr:hypothetical protein [Ktedonobacterales bacterium]